MLSQFCELSIFLNVKTLDRLHTTPITMLDCHISSIDISKIKLLDNIGFHTFYSFHTPSPPPPGVSRLSVLNSDHRCTLWVYIWKCYS